MWGATEKSREPMSVAGNRLVLRTKPQTESPPAISLLQLRIWLEDFPGGRTDGNPPAKAGDMSLISGPGTAHVPRSN